MIVMEGEDQDAIDSNADLIISGGTIEISGAGIHSEWELDFSGGTVIIDGRRVISIPNQNTNQPGA